MDILAQYNDSDCEHERITPAEADSCSSNEDEEAEAMDLDLREEAEGALDDLAYAAGYADVDVVEGADAGLQIPMLLPEAASREDSDSEDGSDYESDGSAASKNLRSKWADLLTEEEAESFAVGPPRSKHELDPDSEAALLAPTVSTIVTGPCSSLQAAGEVVYFIQQEGTLVIRALRPGLPHAPCTPGLATLNEGSLLCDEHGNVLGAVQEVFGPVADPFYLVRVPSATPSSFEGVHDRTVPTTGQIVYTASEHATFLSAAELLRARAKGSDASNAFDEEVNPMSNAGRFCLLVLTVLSAWGGGAGVLGRRTGTGRTADCQGQSKAHQGEHNGREWGSFHCFEQQQCCCCIFCHPQRLGSVHVTAASAVRLWQSVPATAAAFLRTHPGIPTWSSAIVPYAHVPSTTALCRSCRAVHNDWHAFPTADCSRPSSLPYCALPVPPSKDVACQLMSSGRRRKGKCAILRGTGILVAPAGPLDELQLRLAAATVYPPGPAGHDGMLERQRPVYLLVSL